MIKVQIFKHNSLKPAYFQLIMGSPPSQFFNSEARKEKGTGLVSIKVKTMKTLLLVDLCVFMAF